MSSNCQHHHRPGFRTGRQEVGHRRSTLLSEATGILVICVMAMALLGLVSQLSLPYWDLDTIALEFASRCR